MQNLKLDKSWIVFTVVAAVFLLIKIYSAHYAISDENTYYKMGQLVAHGQVPYRDFFFGHFPLQIYLYAAVFMNFGFNLLILKLLSAVAVVVTAAFVFAIVKGKLEWKIAVATTALFLFSYGTLLFSNFPTGLEFATPFMMAAFYCLLNRRYMACGLLLGIATVTYQLSVLALPIFLVVALQQDRKASAVARVAAGFAAVVGIVSIVFFIAASQEFIRQVLLYHLQKPSENVSKSAIFLRILKTNWQLFLLAAVAVVSRYRNKVMVLMPLGIALTYIMAYPIIKTAFNYYLLFAFPFLALMAGYGILSVAEFLVAKIKLHEHAATALIVALVVAASLVSVKQFTSYDFQDFSQAEEIAGYVQANSQGRQTIFGDDSTVPLISLLSGREVALNYADNNDMRYKSGVTSLDASIMQLHDSAQKGELKFVLLRRIKIDKNRAIDFGIGTEDNFTKFVDGNCALAREFDSEWRGLVQAFDLYDCQKDANSTAATA